MCPTIDASFAPTFQSIEEVASDREESAGEQTLEDQTAENSDSISKHLPPEKSLKNPEELLLAAFSCVEERNRVLEKKDMSKGTKRRKEFLSNPRSGAVKHLLTQSSQTGTLILDSLSEHGNLSAFTLSGVEAIEGEDGRLSNKGGIYCIFGFDKHGSCDYFYVGQAKDFAVRAENHFAIIEGVLGQTTLNGNSIKAVAHRARKDGNQVFFRPLAYLADDDDDDASLVWEPVWSALMGSFQKQASLLRLRSQLGLPQLSIRGANQTECFEISDTYGPPSKDRNKDLHLIKMRLTTALAALISAKMSIIRKDSLPSENTETESTIAELTSALQDAQKEYQAMFAHLLRQGRLNVRFMPHQRTWAATNFFHQRCSFDALKHIFGEQALLESRRTNMPLFAAIRLHVTDTHSSTDFFTALTPKDCCLAGGIKLRLTGENGRNSWWTTATRVKKIRRRLLEFLFALLSESDRHSRLQKANSVPVISTGDAASNVVTCLLNGEVRAYAMDDSRYKLQYQVSLASPWGFHELPSSVEQRDSIAAGKSAVYFAVNPDSRYPLFPASDGLETMGLDFQDWDGKWNAITRTHLRDKGLRLRAILLETVHEWIRLGRPTLVTMGMTSHSATPPSSTSAGPPADSDSEPYFFRQWQYRTRHNVPLRMLSVALCRRQTGLGGATPHPLFSIPWQLSQLWFPLGPVGNPTVTIKIDAWKKDRAEARIWMRLDSEGANQGVWYDRGAWKHALDAPAPTIPDKIWNLIEQHQNDAPGSQL